LYFSIPQLVFFHGKKDVIFRHFFPWKKSGNPGNPGKSRKSQENPGKVK
jgi:hypothetical protein